MWRLPRRANRKKEVRLQNRYIKLGRTADFQKMYHRDDDTITQISPWLATLLQVDNVNGLTTASCKREQVGNKVELGIASVCSIVGTVFLELCSGFHGRI
jgi:hypothetical protein